MNKLFDNVIDVNAFVPTKLGKGPLIKLFEKSIDFNRGILFKLFGSIEPVKLLFPNDKYFNELNPVNDNIFD